MRTLGFLTALSISAFVHAQDQPPGRPGWPCAGRPDPTYVRTAEATGGQLFMFHPSEVADSGALMAASFTHRETLFRAAGPLDEGLHEYAVTVDGSVESALFSVSLQCLQVVEIERPSGALVQASDEGADYHQFEAGRIVVLSHPEPGTWKVRASGRGVGFVVVQAQSALSLGRAQLLATRTPEDAEDPVPVFTPARAGAAQEVVLSISGGPRNVEARLVSARFEDLGPVMLAPAADGQADAERASWRGRFVVPAVPFRIVVLGAGPDGRPFVRVHAPLMESAGR
jgi:hypothetical protein